MAATRTPPTPKKSVNDVIAEEGITGGTFVARLNEQITLSGGIKLSVDQNKKLADRIGKVGPENRPTLQIHIAEIEIKPVARTTPPTTTVLKRFANVAERDTWVDNLWVALEAPSRKASTNAMCTSAELHLQEREKTLVADLAARPDKGADDKLKTGLTSFTEAAVLAHLVDENDKDTVQTPRQLFNLIEKELRRGHPVLLAILLGVGAVALVIISFFTFVTFWLTSVTIQAPLLGFVAGGMIGFFVFIIGLKAVIHRLYESLVGRISPLNKEGWYEKQLSQMESTALLIRVRKFQSVTDCGFEPLFLSVVQKELQKEGPLEFSAHKASIDNNFTKIMRKHARRDLTKPRTYVAPKKTKPWWERLRSYIFD